MPTPNSSATAYADGDDLVARYDAQFLSELVSDSGTVVDAGDVPDDDNVAAALLDASGEVEAACLQAGRYQPEDLQALTGAALGYLKKIVCGLAVCNLMARRWPDKPLPEGLKAVGETLEKLRVGERIFGLEEVQDAAQPLRIDDTLATTTPGLTDWAARLFGRRSRDVPKAY